MTVGLRKVVLAPVVKIGKKNGGMGHDPSGAIGTGQIQWVQHGLRRNGHPRGLRVGRWHGRGGCGWKAECLFSEGNTYEVVGH
jgi:hypothetical protein